MQLTKREIELNKWTIEPDHYGGWYVAYNGVKCSQSYNTENQAIQKMQQLQKDKHANKQ